MPRMQPRGDNDPSVRRRNKAVVRRMMDAFNTGDTDIIDEVQAPDYFESVPFPGEGHGREALKEQIRQLHAAFSDLHFEELSCVAEGDIVVLRHRMTGIHRAPFLGAAPTGRRISYPGIEINRLRDGLIIEHVGSSDVLEFLDALGVLDGDLLQHPGLRRLRARIAERLVNPLQPPVRPGPAPEAAAPSSGEEPARLESLEPDEAARTARPVAGIPA